MPAKTSNITRTLAAVGIACLVAAAPATAARHHGAKKPHRAHRADATTDRLFAPDSVWNARLADDAPLDPTNDARMAAFAAEARSEIKRAIGPWIAETQYSTPIYTVGPDQPRASVKIDAGSWANPLKTALAAGVPIPADAKPAKGTDGHMTIYQPATDSLWEFWRAKHRADGWHASWGGAMQNVSTSPGYYSSSSWPGLRPSQGWNFGSSATSLPIAAGVVRISELRAGEITHALAIDLPDGCRTTFAWPAQRTDGGSKSPNCIPEGAHLRLDPSLDLSKLDLPWIDLVLARAAQRYGMIVRDRTHHAIGFYAEDPTPTGADPYNGKTGFYAGQRPWKFMPKFPWAHVQLLGMHLCTKAPCTRPAG
jgi:hypothetical protein